MTEPNPIPTSEQLSQRERRKLPDWAAVWRPEDEDDDDTDPSDDDSEHQDENHDADDDDQDDDDSQQSDQPAEQPPSKASIGEILLEIGRDPGCQRHFERLRSDPLRVALAGRDLHRLSRLAALPVHLVEGFARGANLSPGSRVLLTRALCRRPSRPARLNSWLRDGRLQVEDAARVLGVSARDIEAIAAGKVSLATVAWQRLERAALGQSEGPR